MTMHFFPRAAVSAVLFALTASAVWAQSILVTTGEHADFTRLVLQSSQPIAWQLQVQNPDDNTRTLDIPGANTRIDISRAFQRIPRTRLADLRRTQEGLELQLNCDCPIEAWTERPGLVVLDIGNPRPTDTTRTERLAIVSRPISPRRPPDSDLARNVGIALARNWPADDAHPGIAGPASRSGSMPSIIGAPERQEIMQQLTAQVAGALAQGILDPSHDGAVQPEMILLSDAATEPAGPPNMRIMSVLDRPDSESALLPDDAPNSCAAAAALDFAIAPAPGDFNLALAAGMSDWIGEFDQPVQSATEALVILYLQYGFGAEARALLENAVHPIPGRDLLLGFADTLEDRQSNSRLRLAEQHECGGAAAMLAALAGAPPSRVRARAREIASIYAQVPGVLRTGVGSTLTRILLDADAVDAARVVADTLRRTPNARTADLLLADALLDHARGESQQARARLSQEAGDDIDSVLLHLQLALETRAVVPDSVLLNAEAMASVHRSTPQGAELLAAIIRLRVNAGTPAEALNLIDRLEGWEASSTQGRALIAELADMIWFGLALQASDAAFLDLVLNRSDWRNPSFSAETRTAIAERLLGFGLTEAAETLLAGHHTEAERHLLARLYLDRDAPALALDVLADDRSDAAESLRARAHHARGENRASSQIFAGIGAFDAAARTAVLARDWTMLEEAWATDGTPAQRAIARALAGLTADAEISRNDTGTQPNSASSATNAIAFNGGQPWISESETPPQGADVLAAPENAITTTQATSIDADSAPTEQPDQRAAVRSEPAPISSPAPMPNAMDRSAALLAESETLRAALAPLMNGWNVREN